jgi:DNA invertase Pin-like site-specific DNA recombinase
VEWAKVFPLGKEVTMEHIRCAIYVRKSNPENAAEKVLTSLESQEMFVREVVARHENWRVVKVYSDHAFTGENTNRPAFKELVRDIKAGLIDKIVVYRLDRIMRSLEEFIKFRADLLRPYNSEIVSATEELNMNTLDGEFMMNLKMVFAEHELKVTRVRTKDKFSSMRKMGRWGGGPTPVG